jgi:hypothetical protein
MPCEQRRILERKKEIEDERKRKLKREEEIERKKKERERFQKALKTIREQAKKWQWMLTEIRPNFFIARKPYSLDTMEINVLKDGIIKTNTPGKISMPNHENADQFLKGIADKLKPFGWKPWKIFHKHGMGEAHTHRHTHEHHH